MAAPLLDDTRPRRLRLPRSRRLTIDVLHYHRQVPTCAHDRVMNLSQLATQRAGLSRRLSWSMLFIKAYGLVAAKYPTLRQTYMPWPWPHVYQHPHSVAMVATHREIDGEPWLFWSRFTRPEKQPLLGLQESLEHYQSRPTKEAYLRQWQLSGLPTPLRRMLWWWTLNTSGVTRARRVGTFFLTTISGKGAEIQHPPAFLTANMTFGPLDGRGLCRVTIAYDHRLMDGSFVGDCLAELEATLNGPIADELRDFSADYGEPSVRERRLSA